MKQALRALLVLVAITMGHAPAANAALLFENYNPAAVGLPGNLAGTWGTEFTVGPQALSVLKLGTFSVASSDMSVGIWRVSDQTLVGSVEVPSVGGILMQGWNFASAVTPFTLLANTTYRIGAETELSTTAFGGTYTLGSGIASVVSGHVWAAPPGLDYPAVVSNARFFAANAEVAPIPEPSSFMLLAFGLFALWIARRRVS